MSIKKLVPYLLAFFQFLLLGIIVFTGPLLAKIPVLLIIELFAIAFGILAVLNMRVGNFNITPKVKQHGKMVSHGIYKMIRHPMYLSILVFITPLIINHFTWFRLGMGLALLIDLILKLEYEERLLIRHFEGYREYRKKSYKLLPFIY